MAWIPSIIKAEIVSSLGELDKDIDFLKHKSDIYNAVIYQHIEQKLRECFAREIYAYHDTECQNSPADLCTCIDLANIIAPDITGEEEEDV